MSAKMDQWISAIRRVIATSAPAGADGQVASSAPPPQRPSVGAASFPETLSHGSSAAAAPPAQRPSVGSKFPEQLSHGASSAAPPASKPDQRPSVGSKFPETLSHGSHVEQPAVKRQPSVQANSGDATTSAEWLEFRNSIASKPLQQTTVKPVTRVPGIMLTIRVFISRLKEKKKM
jgi:hypothetical protein